MGNSFDFLVFSYFCHWFGNSRRISVEHRFSLSRRLFDRRKKILFDFTICSFRCFSTDFNDFIRIFNVEKSTFNRRITGNCVTLSSNGISFDWNDSHSSSSSNRFEFLRSFRFDFQRHSVDQFSSIVRSFTRFHFVQQSVRLLFDRQSRISARIKQTSSCSTTTNRHSRTGRSSDDNLTRKKHCRTKIKKIFNLFFIILSVEKEEKTLMLTFCDYPFVGYAPNKALAICFATIVAISLSFWLFQSYRNRFYPPRISFLLGVSHLTILIDLILRAALDPVEQNSRTVFILLNTFLVIGQRMLIVSNFVFFNLIRREKSRFLLLIVILSVVTSGILMSPATMFSFDSARHSTSYIFRIISASILFIVTISFYFIWFLNRKTFSILTSTRILLSISSSMCFLAALFNLVESFPRTFDKLNDEEFWFYVFQLNPIVVAHCTWSILHPQRTLRFDSSTFPLLTSTLTNN